MSGSFSFPPPLLWAMDIDGDATIGDQITPLSLSFEDDIIKNVGMIFTTLFEVKKGPVALFFEYQYVSLNH